MIKLGIFGDQTTNHELLGQLKIMPGVEIVGLYFSGNATDPDGFPVFSSPIGLMDVSDAILILSDKNIKQIGYSPYGMSPIFEQRQNPTK